MRLQGVLPGYLPHCWTTLFPFMWSLVHGVYKSSVLYGNHSFCCALFLALAIMHIRSYCRQAAIRWGRTLVTLEFGADEVNLQRQKNYQEKLINRQLIIYLLPVLIYLNASWLMCFVGFKLQSKDHMLNTLFLATHIVLLDTRSHKGYFSETFWQHIQCEISKYRKKCVTAFILFIFERVFALWNGKRR